MAGIRNTRLGRITQGAANMIRINEIWFSLPRVPRYVCRDGYCHGSGENL